MGICLSGNSDCTVNGKGVKGNCGKGTDVKGFNACTSDVKGTDVKGFNPELSDVNVGNVAGVNMNRVNGSNETSLSMDKTGKNCCRKSIILCCSYKQLDSSEFNFSKN